MIPVFHKKPFLGFDFVEKQKGYSTKSSLYREMQLAKLSAPARRWNAETPSTDNCLSFA